MIRFLLWTLLCLLGVAGAQTFALSPTAFNMDPARTNTAQVRMDNTGDAPMMFQLEIRRWTTENGQHVYTPTRDVVVNPAQFTLEPGKSQVIRVGLLKKVGNEELAYRVFVRQVPTADVPSQQNNEGNVGLTLRQLVQVSMPVYVAPASSAPKMSYGLRLQDGKVMLDLTNAGNRHLTLRDVNVVAGEARLSLGNAAVLGGSTLSLPLTLDALPTSAELVYSDMNGEERREPLRLP